MLGRMADQQPARLQRWEYHYVYQEIGAQGAEHFHTRTMPDGLRALGEGGWELVGFSTGLVGTRSFMMIFKRPILGP